MNRSFYLLLISQTATNLGFALYTMIVVMHLYNETASTTLSALVTLISVSSRMVSGLVLTSFSDRFQLIYMLRFSQGMQLILLSVLLLLFFQPFSIVTLVIIFIVLGLISFFNGFFGPIKSSIVRSIVPVDMRVKANSLIASVDQTFLFAGWTFGGLLLAFLGKELTLVITISLMASSILCLFFIQSNNVTSIQTQGSLISRLSSGWKYLFQHKGLRVLVMMDLMEALVGTIWIGAVTLTYVEDALGKGEAWWGYINGGYYFGTIVGGFLVYRLSKLLDGRLTLFMLGGSFFFGLLTCVYGLVTSPIIALVLVILMGPSFQIRDLAQETMYQNCADEKVITKIFAAKSALIQFIFLFSILGIGIITDLIGVRFVYILSGILLVFSSFYGFVHLYIRKKGESMERQSASA